MGKKEYMQANKDWLAEKAKEEGVMPLPKGIYYKVLFISQLNLNVVKRLQQF